MSETLIILDAGHRPQTKGKRSPDGKLVEHYWAVDSARRVQSILAAKGVKSEILPYTYYTSENADLNGRVRAINAKCKTARCAVVSIHCNAAMDGSKWCAARGWSIFVAPNASESSKFLAECIFSEAKAHGFKVRQQWPNVGYWVQSLAICRDTACPAVLIENFFMDNPDDCAYLLSEQGRTACAEVAANGILEYLKRT